MRASQMNAAPTTSELASFVRNYAIVVGLLVLILIFIIYNYLYPRSIEFFEDAGGGSSRSSKTQKTRVSGRV
jgi:hypothetical protein